MSLSNCGAASYGYSLCAILLCDILPFSISDKLFPNGGQARKVVCITCRVMRLRI